MEEIIAAFADVEQSYLKWAVLSALFLLAETVITAGLFLWLSLAGFITALVTWVLNVGLASQVVAFSVLSVVVTTLWAFLLRGDKPERQDVNNPSAVMLGESFVLREDHPSGKKLTKIKSTFWTTLSEKKLSSGTRVEIVDTVGVILKIKEVDAEISDENSESKHQSAQNLNI